MKKVLVILLACLFVISLLTGCSSDDKSAAPAKPVQMILATGGTAGTYYPFGGAMAQIFNTKTTPAVNVTAQATGASIENLRLLNKKEVELALVQSDMMDYAYKGRESFKTEKLTNFSGIAILYPEIIQVVVRADSGINSIADLKGKKVGVGAPGSGAEANFRQLLDTCGMDMKSIVPQFLSFSESADQFKDNHIAAFIVVAGIPNSAIQDIASQHSIKVLSLSDDMIAKANQRYPFLAGAAIPANTYKGQDEAVKTMAIMATLVVNNDVKEDIVYGITKALFENQVDLAKAHAKGKELSLETAVKGMSVPFHPGAAKYFKEKGAIK